MPLPSLIAELRACLGVDNVIHAPSELAVYDCDAFTVERRRPAAVVLPQTVEQVAAAVEVCSRHSAPIVARGAGTGLAGGCVPSPESVVLMLTRLNHIVEINLRDRIAVVEAGVANLQLARALAGSGYHFAPDPSSQGASTLGGNVATNAGGPHTLAYGVTINHVLGLEAVLADGRIVQLGPVDDPGDLDITGLLVGSEGRLAIVTKAWLRLTPNPHDFRALRATFDTVDDATNTVSQIIAAGIIPAAMELMDRGIIGAVEDAYHFGFPRDVEAVLIIEVDGPTASIDQKQQAIVDVCRRNSARQILEARSAQERETLWKCRKMAVGAVGRLSPSYIIQDGVVPRTKLPHLLRRIAEIAAQHSVRIVNVAHAGDGNVHPILLFDDADLADIERAMAAGRELLAECIACGGSVTAEHGVGIEKLEFMERLFDRPTLDAMRGVAQAFDPQGLLNPGKLLPQGGVCKVGTAPQAQQPNGRCPPYEYSPESAAAVADCVREAAAAGVAVYSVGGNTHSMAGGPPASQGIELSLRRLDHVIDYQPDDMTITVEPGLTIAALSETLAQRGQRLPVDLANPTQGTIGGAVAINRAGPRRFAYGTLRDYVLGVSAVDGRGNTLSMGGRVVKNAAGLNLARLMVGSFGSLGVITQVTLMVRPKPEVAAIVAYRLADLDAAEPMLAALNQSTTRPVSVDLLVGSGWNGSLASVAAEGVALLVGFEGPATEVDWMLEQLRAESAAVSMVEPVLRDDQTRECWQSLADFDADIQINTLPSQVVGAVALVRQLEPEAVVVAHAATGNVFAQLAPRSAEAMAARLRELRPALAEHAMRLVVRKRPAAAECTAADVWGPPGHDHGLAQAIKQRFDPDSVLNPGRFL